MARRPCDLDNYAVTADDVHAVFNQYPKTKEGARRLLHSLGVRFKSNGAVSHVIPL